MVMHKAVKIQIQFILKETDFFLHQMFVTEGRTSSSIICISDFSINEFYLI